MLFRSTKIVASVGTLVTGIEDTSPFPDDAAQLVVNALVAVSLITSISRRAADVVWSKVRQRSPAASVHCHWPALDLCSICPNGTHRSCAPYPRSWDRRKHIMSAIVHRDDLPHDSLLLSH